MTQPIDAAQVAARLTKARADRSAIGPLTAEIPGFDLAAGYAVQRQLRSEAGPLAGWKLGVTSRAKQAQVGVTEPVRGFLAAAHALDIGAPLQVAELIQPRAEPEIAFVIGADLAGPAVSSADVLAATYGVAVAIEILDSVFQDYRFAMADVVADNTSAGRYLVGPCVSASGIDLRLTGVVLGHNGEVVATAAGAAALGHPAAAVAWLVRSLAADGEGLHAGNVVLSGGLTAAIDIEAGDVVTVTADRLGSLELACR
jgi:2-keto-4-pentenoate hydratase